MVGGRKVEGGSEGERREEGETDKGRAIIVS